MIGLDLSAFVLGVILAVEAVLLAHEYYKKQTITSPYTWPVLPFPRSAYGPQSLSESPLGSPFSASSG